MEQEDNLALRIAPHGIAKRASVAEFELRIHHGQVRLCHWSTIFRAHGPTQADLPQGVGPGVTVPRAEPRGLPSWLPQKMALPAPIVDARPSPRWPLPRRQATPLRSGLWCLPSRESFRARTGRLSSELLIPPKPVTLPGRDTLNPDARVASAKVLFGWPGDRAASEMKAVIAWRDPSTHPTNRLEEDSKVTAVRSIDPDQFLSEQPGPGLP